MGVEITVATAEDRKAIDQLSRLNAQTKEFRQARWLQMGMPELLEQGLVGIARQGGALVGFCVLEPRPRLRKTRLSWLGIAPEAKRQGIGTLLLAWAKMRAPHYPLELYCDPANEEGVPFYLKHGFRVAGTHVTSGKMFDVMVWNP